MTNPDLTGADVSARLLSLPLAACRAVAEIPARPIPGMPACTVEVPALRLLIASTQHAAPMFANTLEQVSRRYGSDILLIRGGRHPELLDPVTVDVALRYDRDAILITDMLFFRHADRGLWLVPAVRGPFVELTPAGLRLEMLPPFADPDDRSAGLCRAATEIARLARGQAGGLQ